MDKLRPIRIRYSNLTSYYAETPTPLIYTQDELNSLRYYKGAVKDIVLSENESSLGDFYAIPNAYETLNVLLYPGISNEQIRIVDEKREIFPRILDNMSEILKVYENLATAIYKYTYSHPNESPIKARRFDRAASLDSLMHGQNCAFMSTTLVPDLNYFHRKKGLILEEVEAPAAIEHIDINEVLGNQSDFAEEQEILFPPFLNLKLESRKLNEQEQTYEDCEGKPPAGKYSIQFTGSGIELISTLNAASYDAKIEKLKERILRDCEILNAKAVWNRLLLGQLPDGDQEKIYTEWKADVEAYVRLIFCRAKSCISQNVFSRKAILFQDELNCALQTNNSYRKRYDKYVETTGIIISVCNALVAFFLALSFINHEVLAVIVKVVGLLLSCLSLIVSGICKCKVWEGKLNQRTYTFLKLDELQRDFRYEEVLDEAMLKKYVERLKEILYTDNAHCERNTELAIDHLDSLHDTDY